MRGWRQALVVAVVALAVLAPSAAAREEPLPPQGPSPSGTNDFSCRPPARHPYPIVLVHGTFLNMQVSWTSVAPALNRLGYCVFALDYGNSPVPGSNAVGDIPTSARQLKTFVDRVLAATGAAKVSLVGHSQGGMMPRYWMKNLGGARQVDDLIGFSPSNHGTTTPAAGPAGAFCPACAQQAAGSPFITDLNAGDETPGGASFTVVQTRNDEVVTPYQSAFLAAGPAVTNELIQDTCPTDNPEHITMPYDRVAIQWMLNALGRPGPADPAFRPDCTGSGVDTYPDSDSTAPAAAGGGSAGTSGAARLVVGHAPHSARTTGRRRMRVAVAAPGGSMRQVRVAIAGPSGKVLGRSALLTVGPKRRVAVVRLKRRLRAGRYTLTAKGRDAVTGRAVSASRTIRLR